MMRIAASTYLNSAPLVDSFARGRLRKSYEFIGDTAPAKCSELLASGECEVALIPAIEYQRIPDLKIIPGVAVASKNRVRSVLIASRCRLGEVRRLALDRSSRSSQGLVRILLRHRYGIEPELIERTPDPGCAYQNMFEEADAALVIGDPAMQVERMAPGLGLRIHDLAAEWREMTGHPFVFAIWAVRAATLKSPEMEAQLSRDFQWAREDGLGQLEALAAACSADLGIPVEDLLSYLRLNVNYDLDDENLRGLARYYELAHQYGLIAQNRPLDFLQERIGNVSAVSTLVG